MTTKADYTTEEWNLLTRGPLSIAAAVIASDLNGPVGVAQEFMSLVKILEATHDHHTKFELINAVADDAGTMPVGQPALAGPASDAEAVSRAVNECREIASLLGQKTSGDEAKGFARWLMKVAQTVAEAAREEDEFGLSVTMVSDREIAAMHQLEHALGLMD